MLLIFSSHQKRGQVCSWLLLRFKCGTRGLHMVAQTMPTVPLHQFDRLGQNAYPCHGKWGHPLKGPCQEEKLILCEKIYFLAKLQC